MLKLTEHAKNRVIERLSKLVTIDEVVEKCNHELKNGLPKGRSYREVKKINYIEIPDPDVIPDGIARGDRIIAVIDNDYNPRITTVLLRKSWSKSTDY
jgi:hypothetical protein